MTKIDLPYEKLFGSSIFGQTPMHPIDFVKSLYIGMYNGRCYEGGSPDPYEYWKNNRATIFLENGKIGMRRSILSGRGIVDLSLKLIDRAADIAGSRTDRVEKVRIKFIGVKPKYYSNPAGNVRRDAETGVGIRNDLVVLNEILRQYELKPTRVVIKKPLVRGPAGIYLP